jgi:hypothetical protein
MEEKELRLAFGPVGATGLVLLALGVVRRSSPFAAAGAVAVMADATFPRLGGLARQLYAK